MKPKHRIAIFLGAVFVLMAPYLGFVAYYSQRLPSKQLPAWFTNTLAIWFIANFLLLMLLAKKILRAQVAQPEKARRASVMARNISLYLLIVWCSLFIYGVTQTVQGQIPLNRAIPAGAFLLFFIGLFGWGLYRERRGKA
jgi:hydrogenase-4 membrane subunit HyfE